MKIEDVEAQIREAGRPRAAAAGARLNRATLDRLVEVCSGIDSRAAQPRLGNIPLVVDSSVPDDRIWLMTDQGEALQELEITAE